MNETDALLLDAQRASERGDWGRVISGCDELLKRDAKDVDALFLLGVAFLKTEMGGCALQVFNVARQATMDHAKLAAIWNNIGCALKDYHPNEAYEALLKALEFGQPQSTHENLCSVSSTLGRHEEALSWAAKAEETFRAGHGPDPAYNKSFALFSLGRWSEAWPEYAKSIGQREGTDRNYGLPRWAGEQGIGVKVLVHGEQGIGDEILFASMLPSDFDGVIECSARNAGLFARSFPAARVHGTLAKAELDWLADSGCTHHLEMGGLGEFYAPAPIRRCAYLLPDPLRWSASQAYLRRATIFPRIGLAWTGGAWATGRMRRSVPFEQIKRLGLVAGVQFVNLEYEDRAAECAEMGWLNPTWATKKGADQDDLAALVASLDLVIAPTTSVVDLAGALGVRCWALVDEHPQWRYSPVAGEDRMWFYDSVRCFRQQARDRGSWTRVISQVIIELRKMMQMRMAA